MKIDSVNSVPKVQVRSEGAQSQTPVEKIPKIKETLKSKDIVSVKEDNKSEKIESKVNDDVLDKSIKRANKFLRLHNREILREVHEVTGTIMYTIKDTETDEIIAEFPPKKIEDMIAKMWEMAGMVVDKKA